MGYVKPEEVTSPVDRLRQYTIVYDEGENRCSYMIGYWRFDNGIWRTSIGYRENGNDNNPIGYPVSNRGGRVPIWHVVTPEIEKKLVLDLDKNCLVDPRIVWKFLERSNLTDFQIAGFKSLKQEKLAGFDKKPDAA